MISASHSNFNGQSVEGHYSIAWYGKPYLYCLDSHVQIVMAAVPLSSVSEFMEDLKYEEELVDSAIKELFGESFVKKGCHVCGCLNARNYYGAMACNSCRAFFARYEHQREMCT